MRQYRRLTLRLPTILRQHELCEHAINCIPVLPVTTWAWPIIPLYKKFLI